jgi:peroxiredoxin
VRIGDSTAAPSWSSWNNPAHCLKENCVKIAAMSYDSQETLAGFAQKYSIRYPLLSDKGSEGIRSFGIFNFNMASELRSYGVPHPVEYLVRPTQ